MKLTRWSACCLVIVAAGSLSACNPAQTARKAKDDVDSGNAAACVQERSTIEKAVQAYMLLNPDVPVTEAAMVAAGIVHQQSVLMDVAVDGIVFPAPGSVCL
jgi:predicted small secreted protein